MTTDDIREMLDGIERVRSSLLYHIDRGAVDLDDWGCRQLVGLALTDLSRAPDALLTRLVEEHERFSCGHAATRNPIVCATCRRTRCGDCFPCHDFDGNEDERFRMLRENYPEDYPAPSAEEE